MRICRACGGPMGHTKTRHICRKCEANMPDETRRVRLWQLRGTEKALLFATLPPTDAKAREVWIPRSQITHISRNPPLYPGGPQECLVDVAEWFAEKEDL